MTRMMVRAALGLGALLLLLAAVIGAMAAWYWSDLPTLDKVVDYRPRQHLQVVTADGVEIAEFGSERRIFVPIAKMPPLMVNALLSVEDWQFREHGGISLRGLARAVVANLTGGMPQGASTITQQVARTFFLSTRRTPERKLKEAMLALQIERRLSKDQILELYMNQVYLGQRAYGFAAAAQVYFGKSLDQLDVAETAMLAGLPQNPSYANPITNLERAKARQQVVLLRMHETGVINDAQRTQAVAEPLTLRSPGQRDVHAEFVAEMARQAVVQRLGDKAYTEGVRVVTSLQSKDQEAAHDALRRAVVAHEMRQRWRGPEGQENLPEGSGEPAAAEALKDYADDEDLRVAIVTAVGAREVTLQLIGGEVVHVSGAGLRAAQPGLKAGAPADLVIRRGSVLRVMAQQRGKATEWTIVQWPQAEAAFVALDPQTGRVRALVGGFDFSSRAFNHVTSAWRQPGSSFKPFIYSAAFESGVMPDTVVDDLPWIGDDGKWQPHNSDGRFDGPMTVREALAKSKNMVSIRLLNRTGVNATRDWATRFGFDPQRLPDNLTLALGSGSTSPMQMATAYAVLANGGYRVSPVVIERITDAQGQVLFEAPPAAPLGDADRVIPARNAFMVSSLLNDVTRIGTAARAQAQLKRTDLYGKTGTTNDAVDAWFAGFQPGVVAVAWMGYDDPRSLGEGESGGGLALPIWIDAMATMLKGVPVQPVVPPDGVVMGARDWRYAEWAETAPIERIEDVDNAAVPTPAPAPGPAPVAVPTAAPVTAPGPRPAAPALPAPATLRLPPDPSRETVH